MVFFKSESMNFYTSIIYSKVLRFIDMFYRYTTRHIGLKTHLSEKG